MTAEKTNGHSFGGQEQLNRLKELGEQRWPHRNNTFGVWIPSPDAFHSDGTEQVVTDEPIVESTNDRAVAASGFVGPAIMSLEQNQQVLSDIRRPMR